VLGATLTERLAGKQRVTRGISIRTKLITALSVLCGGVVVLIGACMIGLYQHQDFTEAMRQGSFEFQKAHQLHRTALELKATKERIHRYNRGEMLATAPLTDPLVDLTDLESGSYWYLLDSFDDQLTRYTSELQDRIAQDAPIISGSDQRNRLEKVRSAYDDLIQSSRDLPHDPADFHALIQRRQEALVDSTQTHLDATSEAIDRYSSSIRRRSRHNFNLAILAAVVATVLTAILVLTFVYKVVHPFRKLLRGARKVANGEHNHRINLGTEDELDELATVLNKMTSGFVSKVAELNKTNEDLDRVAQERANEVIQNEQLASVGFLAAGVAHEINNPLAAIAWSAESLQSRVAEITLNQCGTDLGNTETDDSFQQNLQRIEDEAYRCKAITEKLLEFSKPGNSKRVETNLVTLVHDVVQIVSKVNDFRTFPIQIESPNEVIASINPQEIRQVILNLLTNSLQSLGPNGQVNIKLRETGETSIVTVTDNGCGMTTEVCKNLFEPFYTRRRNGGGTGLGLSISRRIVMQHGGSLQANSRGVGKGSALELSLPKQHQGEALEHQKHHGSIHESIKAA
jgi:two-component system NtrC family sensor kinase